jgi:hypothetical protein
MLIAPNQLAQALLSMQQRANTGVGFGERFNDPASAADLNQSLGQTGVPAGALPPLYARDANAPAPVPLMLPWTVKQ